MHPNPVSSFPCLTLNTECRRMLPHLPLKGSLVSRKRSSTNFSVLAVAQKTVRNVFTPFTAEQTTKPRTWHISKMNTIRIVSVLWWTVRITLPLGMQTALELQRVKRRKSPHRFSLLGRTLTSVFKSFCTSVSISLNPKPKPRLMFSTNLSASKSRGLIPAPLKVFQRS